MDFVRASSSVCLLKVGDLLRRFMHDDAAEKARSTVCELTYLQQDRFNFVEYYDFIIPLF